MLILKATMNNVCKAAAIVKSGGIIVYPTDTVYGLGCDPLNIAAVQRVFKVKGERKKPLPILGSTLECIQKIAKLDERAKRIAEKFWPGPLTFVVPRKRLLPNLAVCNLASVAVRIPNHPISLHLITLCGGLLVGTSANQTGSASSQTADEAVKQLRNEVDLILNGGPTPLRQESSIVDLISNQPKMLREGPIKLEDVINASK